ncbi:MAG: hypothetical protein B6I17_01515 [Tenericutes bacterium 4572_104]|nr:MAG: hypothetical protein B6I17_01515 [Tenericutes bacterium 4572_104]
MKPIKFTYRILEKDYIRVNLWSALEKTPFMRLINRYLIYGFDIIIMIIAIFARLPFGYFMFLIFIVIITLLLRFSIYNQSKKKFRRNPMLVKHDITIEISEEGFRETFVSISYDTFWEEISKVQLVKDVLIINLKSSRILFIPINAIDEEKYDLLLKLLKKHLSDKQIKLPQSLERKEEKQ